jgi:predicted Holliday junction resolvase-like endonuclease
MCVVHLVSFMCYVLFVAVCWWVCVVNLVRQNITHKTNKINNTHQPKNDDKQNITHKTNKMNNTHQPKNDDKQNITHKTNKINNTHQPKNDDKQNITHKVCCSSC